MTGNTCSAYYVLGSILLTLLTWRQPVGTIIILHFTDEELDEETKAQR